MLLETIIASIVPAGIEIIKEVASKWMGGVTPTSIDDVVKLNTAEIEKLKALAELDNPYGTPSQWVVDLRASSRYIAALFAILGGVITFYIPHLSVEAYSLAGEIASIAFGFLLGTRIVAGIKK